MKRWLRFILMGLALMAVIMPSSVSAAVYYTATGGNDEDPGSSDQPWLTIQKAVDTLQSGDTVVVREGTYDERISTTRGGVDNNSRIIFQAEGTVTMRGWRVLHPFITIDGFDITGHYSELSIDAYVQVDRDGNNLELLDCTVRDGIKLVNDEIVFAAPNTITCASGGFLAAGFEVGQTIYVLKGSSANVQNGANDPFVLSGVSDTQLTVSGSGVEDEGPVPAYICVVQQYGLRFDTRAENCVIRGNTFRNLAYDSWFIVGTGHLIEGNVIEQSNGWDAMHFGGANHVFRNNTIRNSPLVVYQVSPDAMENFSPVPYSNVTFTNNFIYGFTGVTASQKGANTSSGLTLTHNVFFDVGRLTLTHPGTTIEHNTFVRVARTSSSVHQRNSHAVLAVTSSGATDTVLRNNIFVDCGEPSSQETEADVGWYEISGPTETIVAEGNFVAGSSPGYGAKTGWAEDPSLNGGDPGFVDIDNPLGPDDLPFTDDDGLRLIASSILSNAGIGGLTIGAYSDPVMTPPSLAIGLLPVGDIRLTWPQTVEIWTLQSTLDVPGGWDDVLDSPTVVGDQFQLDVANDGGAIFFRLQQ